MNMATTNFYILAKPLQSDQGIIGEQRVTTGQPSFTRSSEEREPETRLWKVFAEATSPPLSGLEWVAFLVFGALALGALISCFFELSRLFNNDTLDQTVRLLLGAYHSPG